MTNPLTCHLSLLPTTVTHQEKSNIMELSLSQDIMAQAHAKKKLAVEKLAVGPSDERAHVIFDGVHMRIPDLNNHPLTGAPK